MFTQENPILGSVFGLNVLAIQENPGEEVFCLDLRISSLQAAEP